MKRALFVILCLQLLSCSPNSSCSTITDNHFCIGNTVSSLATIWVDTTDFANENYKLKLNSCIFSACGGPDVYIVIKLYDHHMGNFPGTGNYSCVNSINTSSNQKQFTLEIAYYASLQSSAPVVIYRPYNFTWPDLVITSSTGNSISGSCETDLVNLADNSDIKHFRVKWINAQLY